MASYNYNDFPGDIFFEVYPRLEGGLRPRDRMREENVTINVRYQAFWTDAEGGFHLGNSEQE